MEKICPVCNKDLRCVFTGANVFLVQDHAIHSADIFACFPCVTYHVYGMNLTPLVMWRKKEDGGREEVRPIPNVVVESGAMVNKYPDGVMAHVDGKVTLLPSATRYISEKCGHVDEIKEYIQIRTGGG